MSGIVIIMTPGDLVMDRLMDKITRSQLSRSTMRQLN